MFEFLFFTRDETLVSVVYSKKKAATRKTGDIKKKKSKSKKEKNNRSRGRSGIALFVLYRHPLSTFKSHHTGFRPVLQKTPSSPLPPHSPATTADHQPAAAESFPKQ